MSLPFLEAVLEGDFGSASNIIGIDLPPDWNYKRSTFARRALQLRENPSYETWSLRAMVRRDDHALIGQIGFHTSPSPEYLEDYAPDGIEIGYSVLPEFRNRGYASEACRAMMEWASHVPNIRNFVLSISPANQPSLRVAQKLGFKRIGSQWDEEDGEEDVYLRPAPYVER